MTTLNKKANMISKFVLMLALLSVSTNSFASAASRRSIEIADLLRVRQKLGKPFSTNSSNDLLGASTNLRKASFITHLAGTKTHLTHPSFDKRFSHSQGKYLDLNTYLEKVEPINTKTLFPEFWGSQVVSTKTKENTVRIVFVSDLHNKFYSDQNSTFSQMPIGDILVITGDLTDFGTPKELIRVHQFFETLLYRETYRYIVFIAGNHDRALDPNISIFRTERDTFLKGLPNHVYYLENSGVELEGFSFYGTPWIFGNKGGAFRHNGNGLDEVFNKIPHGTDVLLTHMPPYGHGDLVGFSHVGSKSLLKRVRKVQPIVHAFGHVHSGYGVTRTSTSESTVFINASTCTPLQQPHNAPFVLDLVRNDKSFVSF